MSKNIFKRVAKVFAVCLVILGIVTIYVFDPFIEGVQRYPSHLGFERGYYEISPETILTSLDNGKTEVFVPEIATPENAMFEQYFSWQQSDFTKIIVALHEFVWNEDVKDWKLYYMHFSTPCHDNLGGFELAEYYYFKTIFHNNGQIDYAGRGFLITPQYGDVEWGSGPNYPHPILGWKSVNLNKVHVTAEQALEIAETNGGKEARSLVQNECKVTARLSGYAGWKVFIYKYDTGSSIFRIEIDPLTGKIK